MKQANTQTEIEFTRINNDVNGNPRYVCHFYAFVNDADRTKALADQKAGLNKSFIDAMYKLAIKRAKTLGGRKFHNKQYGGGIVFQSYNIGDLNDRINELMAATKFNCSTYDNIKRMPKGHRFVKQQGYKRGNFHNWAIYDKAGNIISLGGRTKQEARTGAITKFNPNYNVLSAR